MAEMPMSFLLNRRLALSGRPVTALKTNSCHPGLGSKSKNGDGHEITSFSSAGTWPQPVLHLRLFRVEGCLPEIARTAAVLGETVLPS